MTQLRFVCMLYRHARTLPACRIQTTGSGPALSLRLKPYQSQARLTSSKSAADEKMEEITELWVLPPSLYFLM